MARVAALHLAPTRAAASALAAEALCGGPIVVTGNTVVDAALHVAAREAPAMNPDLVAVERELETHGGRLVLVTAHRRESWGAPLDEILGAVATLADRHPDMRVLLPMHPNPAVRAQVEAALGAHPRVTLTEPLAYPDLVRVLRRAALVLTDSGGIQEEAPSFGVPCSCCARSPNAWRPSTPAARGWWAPTGRGSCWRRTRCCARGCGSRCSSNPFGDGQAAGRVCEAIADLVSRTGLTTESVLEPAS